MRNMSEEDRYFENLRTGLHDKIEKLNSLRITAVTDEDKCDIDEELAGCHEMLRELDIYYDCPFSQEEQGQLFNEPLLESLLEEYAEYSITVE